MSTEVMKKGTVVSGIEIVDIGAKGKVIGKKDGVTFMTKDAVPGDIVSIRIKKNKKNYKEGQMVSVDTPSPMRLEPKCEHFDHCGGCSWQNLDYAKQIAYKESRVNQQITRIAHIDDYKAIPILGSEWIYEYRNKLEFTFIEKRWLTLDQLNDESVVKSPGLGFHVPGRFDWVMHIEKCHLEEPIHNDIRNFIYDRSMELGLTFYNPHSKEGALRNLVLRCNRNNEWMMLLIGWERTAEVDVLLQEVQAKFPVIQSLWFIQNQKLNDSFSDCPAELITGAPHIIETFKRPTGEQVQYMIGPKSFFQTNPNQAEKLYQIVYDWANLSDNPVVYDLYTGTGSIALFVADKAQKVVGIEYVPEAIEDAKKNALLNSIDNCEFFAGDMKDILTTDFIAEHGAPDVLITDPPRAGMHADVVERILETAPKRIVYVSCDPATQARDIELLKAKYKLIQIQPVDMFPHTSHVENVALLELQGE